MKISSHFDSGSIEVVAIATDGNIDLKLRLDEVSDPSVQIRQWFHFRLQGARGQAVNLRIHNAGAATYPGGWKDYRACASYDRLHWFRVETHYEGEGGVLTISHSPERDSVYYAYFEPYSWERHLQLLGRAEDSPLARVRDLGASLDGRDLNVIEIRSEAGALEKRACWIIARQHPGEPMAEWLAAGVRLVWVLYPNQRTVYAYRSETDVRVYTAADTLDGGDVLPGFACAVAGLFS